MRGQGRAAGMSISKHTIVIIDDDDSVRRALRRLIRSADLKAATFGAREEFLGADHPAPGCLILDVHLPGLSGLELQERLTAEGRKLPIVFISAYAEEQVRRSALDNGAIAFLYKPFEDQLLLDAVYRAVG